MKVAIQGEPGSFSHEAALKWLPKAQVEPCSVSRDVFDCVVSGKVDCALIPIENTLAGPVTEHLDLMVANPVFIQREFRLRIVHALIAAPGVRLGQVCRVYSHPIALQQCRDFFRANPQIEAVPFYDTAGSVKHVMQKQLRDAAAIAGKQAAAEYGARILKTGLEDDHQNFTRFFLIRKGKRVLPGANKTSLAFALKSVPGALCKALSVFAERDIDLCHIESRPIRGRPWQYVFHVDYLRGSDETTRSALHHLAEVVQFVKVLGVYPAAL